MGGLQRSEKAGEGRGGCRYLVTWRKEVNKFFHFMKPDMVQIRRTWTTKSCPHGRGSHQVRPVHVMLSFSQERSSRTSNLLRRKIIKQKRLTTQYLSPRSWRSTGNNLSPPSLSIFWNTHTDQSSVESNITSTT